MSSYQNTNCGGGSKHLEALIQTEAQQLAKQDMDSHPCGCGVCYANALLRHLHELRIKHGQNPFTGGTL